MNLNLRRLRTLCLVLAGALSLVPEVQSAPFVYNADTDLMLCFRKIGRNGLSTASDDYEVNIGAASLYYGATPGGTVNVGQYTTNQLNAVFSSDLDGVSWSVAGGSLDGDGTKPFDTVWITRKRTNLSVQSVPPTRRGVGNATAAVNQINSMGAGAQGYSSLHTADGTNNTVATVRIPEGDSQGYSSFISAGGIFTGYWGGDAEDTTVAGFSAGSSPSRVDLYELQVGTSSQPGTFLGYFDFNPNGSVVFTAAGGAVPPPAPTITLITRTNATTTLFFTTSGTVLYNLRFTNGTAMLTAPISTWPVVPNVATGDGTVKSVTDVTTASDRVYRIEAHH